MTTEQGRSPETPAPQPATPFSDADDAGGGADTPTGRQHKSRRKPSYVELSCAVSGYTGLHRYASPSGRKATPPLQIPVSSNPQTLDSVALVLGQDQVMRQQQEVMMTNGYKSPPSAAAAAAASTSSTTTVTRTVMQSGDTTVETVTKFYSDGGGRRSKESSPASDNNLPATGDSGNLVQKQIERLYGGKVQSVRSVTSPESAKSPPEQGQEDGGFFAKRFGVTKQKDRHTLSDGVCSSARRSGGSSNLNGSSNGGSPSSPLDFKPLKVPAVFRLLRPEFREQLKSNSCQIPSDQSCTPTSSRRRGSSERVIPIQRESASPKTSPDAAQTKPKIAERVIPVEREGAKPEAPSPRERVIPVRREENGHHDRKPFPVEVADVKKTPSPTKPALPAKPASPPPASPPPAKSAAAGPADAETTTTTTPSATPRRKSTPVPMHNVTSPGLVSKVGAAAKSPEEPLTQFNDVSACLEEIAVDVNDDVIGEEDVAGHDELDDASFHHERPLLSTILEEDNESTASGSTLNLALGKQNNNAVAMAVAANSAAAAAAEAAPAEEVHDGHYYIRLLENEIFKFEELICDFEEDLNDANVEIADEDIRDSLLAAIGKAKLLMAQKLAQFRGLCDKNITQNPADDPFVPTSGDLAGFWDMVYIQVEHIYSLFAELNEVKKNGWKRPAVAAGTNGDAADASAPPLSSSSSTTAVPARRQQPSTLKKKSPGAGGKTATGGKASAGKKKPAAVSAAAKARDEARKKMLEERKRAMKQQQQQQQQQNSGGELFVQF